MTITRPYTYTNLLPDSFYSTSLRQDIRRGLTSTPKTTKPVWFYDAVGSDLYEEITRLPEYYPTRTEHQILAHHAADIARRTNARTLVELGSGSSKKTRLLLDALDLDYYVPVDVSESALHQASDAIAREYPHLAVHAVRTNFDTALDLPDHRPNRPGRLFAFLGSTLGNHRPPERAIFLRRLRAAMNPEDALLLGMDLVKGEDELVAAYDDPRGVTAAFDMHLLDILNHELGADFDPASFKHHAVWSPADQWIEMRLRSRVKQTVTIPALDLRVHFDAAEDWITETSAKVTLDGLRTELQEAGLALDCVWADPAARFSLSLSTPRKAASR
ncbi:L-histidine N(alpha)-methyltransferase [Streptacidiphilus sp. EB103A]|uniref:L-histidine N(alpha)-methyltransferase n=1 Tax=Streptacidiphilus sp. EB103A TaxID=3156275 RepID=UPI003513C11B